MPDAPPVIKTLCALMLCLDQYTRRCRARAPAPGATMKSEFKIMTARVFVSLKRTVLDPQGQTIRASLAGRGYAGIEDVRQGKVFELQVSGSRAKAEQELDEIARTILANPVIEDYRVEWLDK